MPDTVKKKKLDDRTLVARLQAMGATWDDPRWIVPTDQRPALLALLDEAGYTSRRKPKRKPVSQAQARLFGIVARH